jgi:hypothetical protein
MHHRPYCLFCHNVFRKDIFTGEHCLKNYASRFLLLSKEMHAWSLEHLRYDSSVVTWKPRKKCHYPLILPDHRTYNIFGYAVQQQNIHLLRALWHPSLFQRFLPTEPRRKDSLYFCYTLFKLAFLEENVLPNHAMLHLILSPPMWEGWTMDEYTSHLAHLRDMCFCYLIRRVWTTDVWTTDEPNWNFHGNEYTTDHKYTTEKTLPHPVTFSRFLLDVFGALMPTIACGIFFHPQTTLLWHIVLLERQSISHLALLAAAISDHTHTEKVWYYATWACYLGKTFLLEAIAQHVQLHAEYKHMTDVLMHSIDKTDIFQDEAVAALLQIIGLDGYCRPPSYYRMLSLAARRGRVQVVRQLLTNHKRRSKTLEPDALVDDAIRSALQFGHDEMLRMLIRDQRHHSNKNDEAIRHRHVSFIESMVDVEKAERARLLLDHVWPVTTTACTKRHREDGSPSALLMHAAKRKKPNDDV